MSGSIKYDLATLGETMMRLAPPDGLRLGQSNTFNLSFGGAESNVASNLARLGRHTSWWSRLPDNPLGHQLMAVLKGHGVSVDNMMVVPGERLGTYYVEYGSPPRGIKVWYDRSNSAASRMQPEDIPDQWIASSRWLHLTGITPALSKSCAQTTQKAFEQAAGHTTVSFDVNYRALLWGPEVAAQVLEPFCEQADVVFVARRDAGLLFGVTEVNLASTSVTLQRRWGGVVIVTDGDQGAAASDGTETTLAPAPKVSIVDRIGAGDAFASGVIDQFLADEPLQAALAFGVALSALKLTTHGDIAHVTRDEVLQVIDDQPFNLHR